MLKWVLVILIAFILIYHYYSVYKYKNKVFPPNINHTLDETITLPDIESSKEIPKVIFRTHQNEERIKAYQSVLSETKNILPDYETRIFYDHQADKYIRKHFSDRIYKAYKAISNDYGPAKADFFRYLVIYREGGIYLDIKSGPTKNLDQIINKLQGRLALSNWTKIPIKYIPVLFYDERYWSDFVNSSHGEYQNWYIIAGKGNKLLAKIIQQMVTNIEKGKERKEIYSHGKTSVVALTGPLMLTKTVEKYGKPEDYMVFNPHLDNCFKYKMVNHLDIEKNNHYGKNKNKYVIEN